MQRVSEKLLSMFDAKIVTKEDLVKAEIAQWSIGGVWMGQEIEQNRYMLTLS